MYVIRQPLTTTSFQLNWRMTFIFRDERSQPITVGSPLTVEFDIKRFGTATSNQATFSIYNLSRTTRNMIFKPLTDENTYDQRVEVIFEAGYGDNLSVIYHGLTSEVNSYKSEGSPDIITHIFCFDTRPLIYVNRTYSKGTPVKQIIRDIANDCDLTLDAIGNFKTMVSVPYTTNGRGIEEINLLTGSSAYVDNGKLMVLQPFEVVNGTILQFDSTSIFDTPKREGVYLRFRTKFCPEIVYTQLIKLKSDVQPEYNGILKTMGIHHRGSISNGVPCSAETEITGWYGVWKKYLPTNITDAPILTADNSEANIVGEEQSTKEYNVIRDDKIMPVGELYAISLEQIYQDIKKNGKNAKSLSKRLEISNTKITWGQVIQPANFKYAGLPDLEAIKNVFNTTYWLADFIRKNLGTSALRGLVITSGWRNKGNNASYPTSSSKSLHLVGKALDFKFVSGITTDDAWKKAISKWSHGYKYRWVDKGGTIIHVQIGSSKPDRR